MAAAIGRQDIATWAAANNIARPARRNRHERELPHACTLRYNSGVEITLNRKVAIITGEASGIGLATVLAYLDSGIEGVVAVDIAARAAARAASAS